MKGPPTLQPMDPVVGRIEIQDQFAGGTRKTLHKAIDEHPRHRPSRLPIRPLLQTTKRGTTGQLVASFDRALPHRITTQTVMVVKVLVSHRQPVNPLPQQINLGVRDLVPIPGILDHRVQPFQQTDPPIRFAQHHHSAVAGNVPSAKSPFDFAPIKAWKADLLCVTFWHWRSSFGLMS